MEAATSTAERLRLQISQIETELEALRAQLAAVEAHEEPGDRAPGEGAPWSWPLAEPDYERYGRQLILPQLGLGGQLRLRSAAVLVVGAGGLGCPAAAYLAGAGVGTLGIVDGDTVDVSNLHRQVAHATSRVGMLKVDSLAEYCRGLNPGVTYVPHPTHLTAPNAAGIVSRYDLVLDCTDHPTSRYLISDVCVLLQKPLVSASALRTDGQLMVLNNPPAPQGDGGGGPCYRCVFPTPPPPETLVSCGEGGILGPVVGVMGVLQALETIKLIAAAAKARAPDPPAPSLLLLSAAGATSFRSVRMRGRRPNCVACSSSSSLTLAMLRDNLVDYVQFCGTAAPIAILPPEERVTPASYHKLITTKPHVQHLVLDVRERHLFDIAGIPGAVNIPLSELQRQVAKADDQPKWLPAALPADAPIYVVCRVGNDSQLAVQRLKEMGLGQAGRRYIGDIQGGMKAWKQEIDRTMPFL